MARGSRWVFGGGLRSAYEGRFRRVALIDDRQLDQIGRRRKPHWRDDGQELREGLPCLTHRLDEGRIVVIQAEEQLNVGRVGVHGTIVFPAGLMSLER